MSDSRPSNRRNFIKSTAVTAGLLGFPGLARAASQPPSRQLNVAVIGCGNRARGLITSILDQGANIVALCDVDSVQLSRLQAGQIAVDDKRSLTPEYLEALSKAKDRLAKAKAYDDYRRLIEKEKGLDAVIVAAGQRWHVPMSKAALQAGFHVYCEKPLAHTIGQAREMATFMKDCKLVTQIGAQGGASESFRRSIEIIQSGLLGPIREVHCWSARDYPTDEYSTPDRIPAGLNWDAWCGPAPLRPFKRYYLGGTRNWGRWLDFGIGDVADMGAHAYNLPLRALQLGPPIRAARKAYEPIGETYLAHNSFRWEFSPRGKDPAVTLWWHDGRHAAPPIELSTTLTATFGRLPSTGCLFIGERGILHTDAWGQRGVMRLSSDGGPKARGVLDHEAARKLATTMPRAPQQDNMQEFVDACRGGNKTFQGLDVGAQVVEIAAVGMLAARVGRDIDWDSRNLRAVGCPEADQWINPPLRTKWTS